MRWLVAIVLLSTGSAFGDEPDGPDDVHAPTYAPPVYAQPPVVAPTLEPAEIEQLDKSGHSMRVGGFVMVGLGAAMTLTGLILVPLAQYSTTQTCVTKGGTTSCTSDLDVPELATGVALGLAGPGLIYGGLAVVGAGNGRIRRAKAMRLRIAPSLSSTSVGARIAVEF